MKLNIYLIIFLIIGRRDGNLETIYLPDNLFNNWLKGWKSCNYNFSQFIFTQLRNGYYLNRRIKILHSTIRFLLKYALTLFSANDILNKTQKNFSLKLNSHYTFNRDRCIKKTHKIYFKCLILD